MYTIRDNEDPDSIEAVDDMGNRIGYFNFDEAEDGEEPYNQTFTRLIYMHIDDNQKKKGIGTALMKHAVERYGSFILPSRYIGSSDLRPDNYLTEDEGIPFIDKCFDKGILPKAKFFDEREADNPDDAHEEEIEYREIISSDDEV